MPADNEKPRDLEEYAEWHNSELGAPLDRRWREYYTTVVHKVKVECESSDLWAALKTNLVEFDAAYRIEKAYRLLQRPDAVPELQVKPYRSALLKTFRYNVLNNPNWPEPPDQGWIRREQWFACLNDLVRTVIVVKYIDGVQYLIGKLRGMCTDYGVECRASLEAREEGYYAAHLNFISEYEVPSITWDTVRVRVPMELQVTTQIQDLLRALLHKYYEQRREEAQPPGFVWQWDYKSDQFSAAYLGHILHYVEAMIVELRDKQAVGADR